MGGIQGGDLAPPVDACARHALELDVERAHLVIYLGADGDVAGVVGEPDGNFAVPSKETALAENLWLDLQGLYFAQHGLHLLPLRDGDGDSIDLAGIAD